MKLVLLAIGKTSNGDVADIIARYVGKIVRMAPFEMRILPDVKITRSAGEQQQKSLEGARFMSQFQPGDWVILLDERGKQLTSRQFAAMIDSRMSNVRGNIYFVIGGPYGFSPEVYERADQLLSLSAMTFPHDLIRIFFTEQIYRAFTILNNHPYHHV